MYENVAVKRTKIEREHQGNNLIQKSWTHIKAKEVNLSNFRTMSFTYRDSTDRSTT